MTARFFLILAFLFVSTAAGYAQTDFDSVYVEPNIASGASDGGGAAMKSLAETFWNLYQSQCVARVLFFFVYIVMHCWAGMAGVGSVSR